MGLGGFDFASISYITPGLPGMTVTLAGLAVFSLPFLARLYLSALARFLSAIFALFTPVILLFYVIYLMAEQVAGFDWPTLAAACLLLLLGAISFVVLDGDKALSFSKK